jgi:hypothetical protein
VSIPPPDGRYEVERIRSPAADAVHAASSRSTVRDTAFWGALAGILVCLFLLFRTFVAREIAWAYPANYDQTKYLWISYTTYEAVLRDGLARGVYGLIRGAYANGILIHLQALALMLPFGAGRLTVLSVNYASLAVYLLVTAAAVRRVTNSRRLALLAFGLALGSGQFWFQNMVDYRLDFSSMCIFGVFVSLVMRSGVFRERGWALLAGAVAGLLVTNRFLTALYVAGIYAGMLAYFGVRWARSRSPRTLTLLGNAAASAAVGVAVSIPVVWLSRQAIYDYYVVQQGLERSVRTAEFAVDGLLRSWLFYPRSVLVDHAGLPLVLVSALVLAVSAAVAWVGPRHSTPADSARWPPLLLDGTAFLAVSVVVILGALSANITRSPVVGGIMVPIVSWCVVLAASTLLQRGGLAHGERRAGRAAAACAILALAVAVYCQVVFFGRHYVFWANREDSREIARMYREIGQYAEDMGWSQAVLGSDSMRDYLLGAAVTAAHYEASGSLVTFSGVLGASGIVTTLPRDVLLQHLAAADFLILTHRRDASEPPYPIIDALEGIRPAMEEAARSKLATLGQYAIFGRLVDLYARPALKIVTGVSGGWITADGLLVEVPRRLVSRDADLLISGGMNPWVGADTTMACAAGQDGSAQRLVASFVVREGWYVGRCALPADGSGDGPVRVKLSFSKYFVPREKGINEDVRRLVVAAPVRAEVVPRPPSTSR